MQRVYTLYLYFEQSMYNDQRKIDGFLISLYFCIKFMLEKKEKQFAQKHIIPKMFSFSFFFIFSFTIKTFL